jgi:hypothetical protein
MGYDRFSDLDHLAVASVCPATRRALAARLQAEQEYRAALVGLPVPARFPVERTVDPTEATGEPWPVPGVEVRAI